MYDYVIIAHVHTYLNHGKVMCSKEKVRGAKPKATKATRTSASADLELPEWRKDVKVLKRFFQSFLWKYPVHAFIGEIVKGQSSSYPLYAVEMLIAQYKYQLLGIKVY